MSNQEPIQGQQPNQPEWQFCHKVRYNGSLNERLKGQRMTIAIKTTVTSNIFIVSHSILSKVDNFCKRTGRTICTNRTMKHLQMLNTRVDYTYTNEYNIRTPDTPNDIVMTVRQYPYADVVTVSKDIDCREQMDTIAWMFQEGAYLY
jgi:hypothetical protein